MIQTQNTFKLIVAAFFYFILFFPPSLFAEQREAVGKVVAVRGEVITVAPDSVSKKLELTSPVFLHDVIKTRQGRVQLIFKDNTIVTLGRESEMEITKYLWEPDNRDSAMETEVREGSFRIMGGSITRVSPQNFKTHTPSGTIGIRGSMYAGRVTETSLAVVFQGGKGIYVKNDAGMVNITQPGFGTRVNSPGQAPEEPKKISPRELMAFENTLASTSEEEPAPKTEVVEEETTSNAAVSETTTPSPSEPAPVEADVVDIVPSDFDTEAPGIPVDVSDIVEDVLETKAQDDSTDTAEDTATDSDPNETDSGNTGTDSGSTGTDTGTTGTDPGTTVLTEEEQHIIDMLANLGVAGIRSTGVPQSGIWIYSGIMENTVTGDPPEVIKFIVNWDNMRIMAFGDNSADPMNMGVGFGFGTVDSAGAISNVMVLGSGGLPDTQGISALTGFSTFGQFYGPNQEGIGLAMEGYDINLQNPDDYYAWANIAAASLDAQMTNIFTGMESWAGFFVGIAEDMSNPNTNRRVFYNSIPEDFTLAVNKDNGTISGSMSGFDFNNPDNFITGLTLGGGIADSVYITDEQMAAAITGDSAVTIGPSSGGLKPYGNFMVSARKPALSAYTSWGYWEAAYAEPGTGKDYHIHVPGAKWIAGQKTPSTAIGNLVNTKFYGTYSGKAEGVVFDDFSQMTELTNGATSLSIDFDPVASVPVSGSISFDQIVLPVTSNTGDMMTTGFTAGIPTAAASSVNGTFYGPNAEGLGGNFSAKMMDGKHYQGIFAGDR